MFLGLTYLSYIWHVNIYQEKKFKDRLHKNTFEKKKRQPVCEILYYIKV